MNRVCDDTAVASWPIHLSVPAPLNELRNPSNGDLAGRNLVGPTCCGAEGVRPGYRRPVVVVQGDSLNRKPRSDRCLRTPDQQSALGRCSLATVALPCTAYGTREGLELRMSSQIAGPRQNPRGDFQLPSKTDPRAQATVDSLRNRRRAGKVEALPRYNRGRRIRGETMARSAVSRIPGRAQGKSSRNRLGAKKRRLARRC